MSVYTSPTREASMLLSPSKSSPQKLENDLFDRPYLPDCWQDDKRMEALFAPFRLRDVNPEGWDLKMNFWINQLNKWSLKQSKVTFTIEDVQKAFVRCDQQPHVECIKLVVSNMKRNGKIILPEELKQDKKNIKSLSRDFVSAALSIAFVKTISLGKSLFTSQQSNETELDRPLANIALDTRLINREALEFFTECAESHIVNKLEKGACMRTGKFFTLLNANAFAERNIDEPTYDILLTVLESKNKLKVYEDEDGIKIVKVGTDVKVVESDIILLKLEFVKERLEAEASKLDEEMESIRSQARKALESKNREKALSLLKRKKRIENKLKEKDNQIENIEVTYEHLLDTGSQQLLVSAFQMANEILKKNTKQLEDVEETINQVEDTLAEINEITSDINRPLATDAFEADAELELNEMLQDIQAAERETKPKSIRDDSFLRQIADLSIIDSEPSFDNSPIKKTNENMPLEA